MKILLTSTSFQDTPGKHQDLLSQQGFEIHTLRGPIYENELVPIIADYDALICGDDELNEKVLQIGKSGKLKYISKYGVGLDKIDLKAAKELGIQVTNCPGVNQVSVAEHVFALLLSYNRNIPTEYNFTKDGHWKRLTGSEVYGKTMGIIGMGAIGKEVAQRAKCFGLNVICYDPYVKDDSKNSYSFTEELNYLFSVSDIISLHVPLNKETESIINHNVIKNQLKKGVVVINTSRGHLIELKAMIEGLESGKIGAYLTDVLDIEPMPSFYPLKDLPNVLITPHIGSRTFESVERQGTMAVENLINMVSQNRD